MKLSIIAISSLSLLCGSVYADTLKAAQVATSNQVVSAQPVEVQDAMKGEAFLAENKKKPGVVTLPDGLQYKVVKEGKGAQPTDADTVTVNYEGSLIDGMVFDSSYKRGQPASFGVDQVIPGWTEALKMMKVGSTWMLYIPSSLAYGAAGAPPLIGPNETLIFKVELLGINK